MKIFLQTFEIYFFYPDVLFISQNLLMCKHLLLLKFKFLLCSCIPREICYALCTDRIFFPEINLKSFDINSVFLFYNKKGYVKVPIDFIINGRISSETLLVVLKDLAIRTFGIKKTKLIKT